MKATRSSELYQMVEVPAVTVETAAELLSVSVRTIGYWLNDPDSCPCIKQDGRPTLLYLPAVMNWLRFRRLWRR